MEQKKDDGNISEEIVRQVYEILPLNYMIAPENMLRQIQSILVAMVSEGKVPANKVHKAVKSMEILLATQERRHQSEREMQ